MIREKERERKTTTTSEQVMKFKCRPLHVFLEEKIEHNDKHDLKYVEYKISTCTFKIVNINSRNDRNWG